MACGCVTHHTHTQPFWREREGPTQRPHSVHVAAFLHGHLGPDGGCPGPEALPVEIIGDHTYPTSLCRKATPRRLQAHRSVGGSSHRYVPARFIARQDSSMQRQLHPRTGRVDSCACRLRAWSDTVRRRSASIARGQEPAADAARQECEAPASSSSTSDAPRIEP